MACDWLSARRLRVRVPALFTDDVAAGMASLSKSYVLKLLCVHYQLSSLSPPLLSPPLPSPSPISTSPYSWTQFFKLHLLIASLYIYLYILFSIYFLLYSYFLFNVQSFAPIHKSTFLACGNYLAINVFLIPILTAFTVGLSILHVEGAAFDWLLAGHADEAVDVPRLLQGVHHLLQRHRERERDERETMK